MFQANQAWGITKTTLETRFWDGFRRHESMYFGIMMAILVGLSLSAASSVSVQYRKIIPIMCGIYVIASLVILEQCIGATRCSRTHLLEGLFSKRVSVVSWVLRFKVSSERLLK